MLKKQTSNIMLSAEEFKLMKIAAIQICSTLHPKENLKKIKTFIEEAKTNDVEVIFLPEVFYSMSDGTGPTPYLIEGENEHYRNIQKLATDHGVYILGGSVAVKENDQILNRSYNFAPNGDLIGTYDKINLFVCDLSNHKSKQVLDEASVYTPGSELKILDVKEFKLGMSICYDLRFPEMYRRLSYQGANILTISSAFTEPTGRAHWEILVRARAIENQCYVVATGQWGVHNQNIKTWGHSMIVSPWGDVLANAQEGEKVIYADLKIDVVNDVRKRINVIRNP
jgi:deaminated glutathione amidase